MTVILSPHYKGLHKPNNKPAALHQGLFWTYTDGSQFAWLLLQCLRLDWGAAVEGRAGELGRHARSWPLEGPQNTCCCCGWRAGAAGGHRPRLICDQRGLTSNLNISEASLHDDVIMQAWIDLWPCGDQWISFLPHNKSQNISVWTIFTKGLFLGVWTLSFELLTTKTRLSMSDF